MERARKSHAYPPQLAAFVARYWAWESQDDDAGLPGEESLLRLLSVCYQASLMREEERPVAFRLMLIKSELLLPEAGPPSGLHRLLFSEPETFGEDELRRLSPAAGFYRSLIGVEPDERGEFRIWGIVQSGPRWVLRTQGGREFSPPMPPVPVVHVLAPGRLEVFRGSALVGRLEGGELTDGRADVFASRWLAESFAPARAELAALHEQARKEAPEPWAPLDPDLTRMIGQHVVRRMISVLRDSRHGGTILFIPPRLTGEFSHDNPYVTFKHRFRQEEPRRRYRTLAVEVTNRLAFVHGRGEEDVYPRAVGWREYQQSADVAIANLDEAIFEVAHLIAALASVDGAVVISKRFELLGFGVEISGSLPRVETVRRALDLEGSVYAEETTAGVGTRHRSAYRLAAALEGAVAVVVSQDGSVRFVTRKPAEDAVTYWDHA